jgi:serine/threonine protein kinase
MWNWLQTNADALNDEQRRESVLAQLHADSSQRGQAEAFFLIDDNGQWWILKKFHSSCNLDRQYLLKVSSLLPKHDGFICGTERHILTQGALRKTTGYHYCPDLDTWLDGTILMPQVIGFDWSNLADDIRDGSIELTEPQRFTLCLQLSRLIELLENTHCAHRDLSCGNAFIDMNTWQVFLIDFDSLFHPSLTMPKVTTCGTSGYTPHHAWSKDKLDPCGTWCEYADRYALSLLNTEFLLVQPGIEATNEGGIFDQDELKKQSGKGIASIMLDLKLKYPRAAQLLTTAISSPSANECPAPSDWVTFFQSMSGTDFKSPTLDDLPLISSDYLADKIARCRPASPLWPAPSLDDMPMVVPSIPKRFSKKPPPVELPPDPWLKQG